MKKILLFLTAFYLVVFSYAQTGKPDLAFGNGGTITYPIAHPPGSTNFAEYFNMAFQSDGKIVAVGVTTEKGRPTFLISRYNSDGSADKSFNGNGSVLPDFSRGNESAHDVVVQNDGKIVVAGQGYLNNFLWLIVARYNADGSVDNGFNGTGNYIISDNLTGTGGYHYMVLQSDGKIIVAGQRGFIRLNTDGSRDINFGGGFTIGTVNNILLQSDDKILATGYGGFSNNDFVLARYKANGAVDSTFGQNGVAITDMGDDDAGRAIAIQPDGKIVVSGTTTDFVVRNLQFSIARYNANGSLDNSFSDDGKASIDFGLGYGSYSSSYPTGVAIQSNGKIVVGGPAVLARFNADGSLDHVYPWKGAMPNQYGVVRLLIRNNRLYNSSYQIFAHLLEDGLSSGVYYKYYEGTWTTLPNFNDLTQVKSGNSANVDISVRTAGRDDNFAFIWRGYINITVPGSYIFETVSDDGSKVYFNTSYSADSIALVNNDGLHAPVSATGTVNITAAGLYPISVTYFENNGGEAMQLYWTGPGIARQLVPNAAFLSEPTTNPTTDGLSYKYYEENMDFFWDFTQLTPVKTGNSPNVDISVRNPGRNDHFAFVWEGSINITTPGTYTFTITSDDGSRFYFNSLYKPTAIPLIDNDGVHAARSLSGTVNIPSAGSYPIAITYFERDGGESMQVYWSGPGIAMQPIPNSAFSKNAAPVTGGLDYKYFEGAFSALPNFNALTPVKTGNSPNVDISLRTAGRNDNFAFLWEGYIKISSPGLYTFETVSDDGSKLYFNTLYNPAATPTVSNDGLHAPISATGTVNIPAAGSYPISITFFEKDGGENMQVYWSGPGIPRQLIPNAAFSQTASPNGLNYKYYEGTWSALPDFNALTPVKTGYASNLDLNLRTAGRNDNFAFLWEGYLTTPVPGNFTFELVSDDGSKFYFNQFYSPSAVPLINNDGLHAPTSVTGYVSIGTTYPVAITYFEKDGGETLQLYWSAPGLPRQLVPASAFSLGNPSASSISKDGNGFTGVAEEMGKSMITKVYPNPFDDQFNISFYNNKATDDISIAIYDLNGRQLYQQHPGRLAQGNTSVMVNLKNNQIKDGIYLVAIHVNGVRSKTMKLIKQK